MHATRERRGPGPLVAGHSLAKAVDIRSREESPSLRQNPGVRHNMRDVNRLQKLTTD